MTPLPPHQFVVDEESEGDEDYVPPERKEHDSDSDDGARRKTKKARLSGPVQEEEPPKSTETMKAEREALWTEFQATAVASPMVKSRENKPKMVKVRVTHKFAGEEVIEIKEVEEGSIEAGKWPVVLDKGEDLVLGSASGTTSSLGDAGALLGSSSSTGSDALVPADANTSDGTSLPKKSAPGPVPRRPARSKSSLAALAAAATKPKKISTLEKSRLDWKDHLASSSSKEEVDELEKNRKAGGYLEKVDFLQRVEERKEDALSSGKRRR